MSRFNVLTDSQAQQFIDSGYVVVEDCFDSHLARDWIDFAYDRLGCSPPTRPPGRSHACIHPLCPR